MRGSRFDFAPYRIVALGDLNVPVSVSGTRPSYTVTLEERGEAMIVTSDWVPGQPVFHGTLDGEPFSVQMRPILNGWRLDYRGVQVPALVYTEAESRLAALMPEKVAPDTSRMLLCPMPGLVVSIAVEEGQEVKAGETLAVVEAMKMENVLRAERDGIVSTIHAKAGDSLAVDAVMMEFE